MEHEKLKSYMMKFSTEELKYFLGEDLVESLLEWNTEQEAFASKNRLSEMILCIYGTSILKRKDFRLRLFKAMTKSEILDFRVSLPAKYTNCQDLQTIVEVAADTSWKESQVNNQLLRLLGYASESIFEKKVVNQEATETIYSHDKFYELLDYQYIIRQKALNILNSEYDLRRFLIHMPTGTGKTKTATHIICHHYNYNLNKKDEYLKLYDPQLDNKVKNPLFKIMYLILNEEYEEALELSKKVTSQQKDIGYIMKLYYRIICLEHLEKENELNDCINEMVEFNDQIHYVKEIKDKYKK